MEFQEGSREINQELEELPKFIYQLLEKSIDWKNLNPDQAENTHQQQALQENWDKYNSLTPFQKEIFNQEYKLVYPQLESEIHLPVERQDNVYNLFSDK